MSDWFKEPNYTPLEKSGVDLMRQMNTSFWLACPTRLGCIDNEFSAFETDAVWLGL